MDLFNDEDTNSSVNPDGCCSKFVKKINSKYQSFLDKLTPYYLIRWILFFILFSVFCARIIFSQGYFVIAYALGIYLLSLFIAFLSPRVDPAFTSFSDEEPTLPTTSRGEYRPFIRRLPEFKFWLASSKASVLALICTFVPAFNVPVFWPILVIYFIMLVVMTLKQQIKHMIRYRYLPFSYGKPHHKGKEDTGKVINS